MDKQSEYYVNVENSILEDEAMELKVSNYHGEFKKYRPVFRPRPANYYPNSCCDYCVQFMMLVPAWVMCAGLLFGFTRWGLLDTYTFGYICIGVWCLYLLIIGRLYGF